MGEHDRPRGQVSIWSELYEELEREPGLDVAAFVKSRSGTDAASGSPLPGAFERRYELREEIGRGGMAVVRSAFDEELQREVAVKFARSAGGATQLDELPRATILRFLLEAHVTAQLEHPSIVPVHEVGLTERDELYMTMKLVRGRTLRELVAGGGDGTSLGTGEALDVLQRVAEALAFAHERGVVHRDLKPANVMVGAFGEVQVMDWGLAHVGDAPAGANEAGPPVRSPHVEASSPEHVFRKVGTPAYMAPEVASGTHIAADASIDVFGLGGLLYYALWGRPPFDGEPEEALERSARGAIEFPKVGRDGRAIPNELRGICTRALRKDPAERYASAREFADDLRAYLQDERGSGAWTDSVPARVTKWVRRHPRRSIAGTFAALTVSISSYLGSALVLAQGKNEHWNQLQRLEAARGLDARIWDQGGVAHFDVARQLAALLRDTGIRPELGARAAAELDRLRESDPPVHAAVLAVIEDLARSLVYGGVRDAAVARDAAADGRDARIAQRAPDLLALWPAVRDLTVAAETEPISHRLVRVVLDRDEDALPSATEEVRKSLHELAAADLERLGLFLWAAGGAGNEKPELTLAASACFDRAATIQPKAPWPLFYLSVLAYQAGRLPEALRYAFAMYSVVPESPPALQQYALVLDTQGNHEAAIELLEHALARYGDDLKVHVNLGVALGALGRHHEALGHYRRANALNPMDQEARAMLAIGLYRCVHYEARAELLPEAHDVAAALVADEPDFGFGHLALGETLLEVGATEQALDQLAIAAETTPLVGGAQVRLAQVLDELGRLEEAELAYRRLLELAPDDLLGNLNLGRILLDRWEETPDESTRWQASHLLLRAWKLAPKDEDCLTNLAALLGATGDPHTAVVVLEQALEDRPYGRNLRLNYANALADVERFDQSLVECRRILDEDPRDADALELVLQIANTLVDPELMSEYEARRVAARDAER